MKKYLILIIALLLVTGCAKQGDVQPEVQDVVPAEETAPAAPEEAAPAEETPIETPEEPAEEETPGTVIAEELPNEEEPTVDTAPVDEESSLPYQVVLMKDLKFSPKDITIKAGDTIMWVHEDTHNNNENLVHSIQVYGDSASAARSGRMQYGDKYNFTFTEPGDYWFIDIIFSSSMRGTITVTE